MNKPQSKSQQDEYSELQEIYLKWHDKRRPLSGYINELQSLIDKAVTTARMDELERFEWNDAHRYIHTRLAALTPPQPEGEK